MDLATLAAYIQATQPGAAELIADHTDLFKQFSDNPSFHKWLGEPVFGATYHKNAG